MTEVRPNPARPRLLLVDDENQFRLALRRQLELRGFMVADAENGVRALELAREFDPEVVILDALMPGMDGIETLAELKKIHPRCPVIMLTGHNRSGLADEAARFKLFRLIEKPCGLDELLETIAAARVARGGSAPAGLQRWLRRLGWGEKGQ